MPSWAMWLLNLIAPIIVSFLEAEVPLLESEGLAALQKASPALYAALLPILVALKLVPPQA
jgi:hypothetical protein